MTVRLRVAGHPLHPALAHFPVALWTGALFADVFAAWFNDPQASTLGWWALAAGVAAGLPAMLAGAADFARLPYGHRANDTAVAHMLAMGSAWVLFVLALALRGGRQESGVSPVVLAIEHIGVVVMLIGGWLGGRLVYRFGVGVNADMQHEAATR